MSKLYGIIYIFGKVASFFGPLPVDTIDTCEASRMSLEKHANEMFERMSPYAKGWIIDGRQVTRIDIATACEVRTHHPVVGEEKAK
jgi:hypothetical protein